MYLNIIMLHSYTYATVKLAIVNHFIPKQLNPKCTTKYYVLRIMHYHAENNALIMLRIMLFLAHI